METNQKNGYFRNIALIGQESSGKCSLSKAISLASKSLTNLNVFKISTMKNFFVMPIPCGTSQYEEKLSMSLNLSEYFVYIVDCKGEFPEEHFKTSLNEIIATGATEIVICLNKIDLISNEHILNVLTEIKDQVKKILSSLTIKQSFTKFIEHISYCYVSAMKGKNILQEDDSDNSLFKSLDLISNSKNPQNGEVLQFLIWEFCFDNDHCIISGINLSGRIIVDKEYYAVTSKTKLKLAKISTCEGNYVKEIKMKNQFLTLKFDKDKIELETLLKGDIITEHKIEKINSLKLFNTFEAEIFLVKSDSEFISKGSEVILFFINFMVSASVINLLGELRIFFYYNRR